MRRIALNLRGPPVFHRDQHPAGIGAVVRTGGMDDILHRAMHYKKKIEGALSKLRFGRDGHSPTDKGQ